MPGNRLRWRQINIRAVLLLTLTAATFAAGYRSGYERSGDFQFQQLIELLESLTVQSDTLSLRIDGGTRIEENDSSDQTGEGE